MPARARDGGNTVLAKKFAGGQLVLTGANSAAGLRVHARALQGDRTKALTGEPPNRLTSPTGSSRSQLDPWQKLHLRNRETCSDEWGLLCHCQRPGGT